MAEHLAAIPHHDDERSKRALKGVLTTPSMPHQDCRRIRCDVSGNGLSELRRPIGEPRAGDARVV